MGIRSLILFVQLLVAAAEETPSPGGPAIVFFSHPEKRLLDEALLLDAVSIYTRDLGLTVQRSGGMPSLNGASAPTDDVVAVLRARAARIGFWCLVAADGRSIELVVVDVRKQVTHQTFAVDGVPGPDLYRAMALKLRVLATGRENPTTVAPNAPAAGAVLASPGGNVQTGNPPTAEPGSARNSGIVERAETAKPTPRTAEDAVVVANRAPASHSREARRLFLSADYALSIPSGSASWRHAGALHGIVRFRSMGEGDLGLEVAASQARSATAGTISVLDVPVRLGLRAAGPGRLHFVTVGVVAGAHFLSARGVGVASAPGTDRAFTVAASGGFELVARTGSMHGWAPEFRAWIEGNAPRTRFLIRGDPGFEAGAVNGGFSLGVAFPAP